MRRLMGFDDRRGGKRTKIDLETVSSGSGKVPA
jgi:hypothetical protein